MSIDKEVKKWMKKSGYGDFILKEDVGPYKPSELFKIYHRQSRQPVSRQALLAGYLSLWLKRCVMPSPPRDNIFSLTLFFTIQLFFGKALGLLPAKICCIQHELGLLTEAFFKETTRRKIPRCCSRMACHHRSSFPILI